MRSILLVILVCMFLVVSAFGSELLSTKQEHFSANGLSRVDFETGAGKLEIHGNSSAKTIEVTAHFMGNPVSKADIPKILDNLRLTMEIRGASFFLKTESVENRNLGSWLGRNEGYIDITVTLPSKLELNVDDGSGGILIAGMEGNIRVEDGSGEIEINGGNNVSINDGSGGISIQHVQGTVDIHDGSGSIELLYIGGDVRISDGSGSIEATDIGGRLDVPQSGSGAIHYKNVKGEVHVPNRNKRHNPETI
jgi:hypothetical protein